METTSLFESYAQSISSKKMLHYFIWIFLIDFMFFSESFGLNALIIAAITIPAFLGNRLDHYNKRNWWMASLIWLLTAVGVFINGNVISVLAYFIAFFHFAAVSSETKLSIPNTFIQTIPAGFMGVITFFIRSGQFFTLEKGRRNKWLVNLLMITIPLAIFVVFLKLYQAADQDFYELTKFINLDFISWGSIFLYFLLCVFLFGFFFYQHIQDLNQIEDKLPNEISTTHDDKIQQFFGVKNEANIAKIILICLNLMLILYNILDIQFITTEMHQPTSDATLSEVVHAGIYALITSIVLVILIVTYIFRGQLNFQQNKFLKPLVIFWLFLNLLMVTTTCIKNWEYVEFWGLTYKRIGVFVYLFLATIGLLLTIYKVLKKQSFWFLLRNTSLAFAISLTALLTFNWNRAIALYNTNYVASERIDFQYLYELGPDTYAYILQHHRTQNNVDRDIILAISNRVPKQLAELNDHMEHTSWKSTVWSDQQRYQELQQFNFIYTNTTHENN